VAEQLRNSLPSLAPAERRVARALLAVYPAAGLGTVAGLADEASTSSATVVRLVQKLGYAGFPEFQETLRQELASRRSGPLERLDSAVAPGPDLLGSMAGQLGEVARSIASTVPPAELDAAVALLADSNRRIYVAGGRATHPLAEHLAAHLGRFRRDVHVMPRDRMRRLADLLDVTRRDVVLVLDLRRYEAATVELAAHARRRRAHLILVTDVLLSPAARHATVVLPVEVASPSPFDSLVGAVALSEVLVLATMHAVGPAARARMGELERLAPPDTVAE
jgi:DNA-binding MurR/RpiR family transcriptional regulator